MFVVGEDGRCTCHYGGKCPLGRSGMEMRCTREDLVNAGYLVKSIKELVPKVEQDSQHDELGKLTDLERDLVADFRDLKNKILKRINGI